MRYYKFMLGTSLKQIEEKTNVKIKDYSYQNTLDAVNNYMYRNLINNITFLAYREEKNAVLAAFSFDEKVENLQNAYGMITEMLKEAFQITRIVEEPEEITTFQFLDCLQEGKRREYISGVCRIKDNANLWVYDYSISNNEQDYFRYRLDEKIILDKSGAAPAIYDSGVVDEIHKIETHINDSDCCGNAVHYVISARSREAAVDITERILQSLLAANRIHSRRIDVISGIDPELYRRANTHLEELIENNYGGAVVFDLTEKLGHDPTEYVMTAQYIVNLLKRYKNRCLFFFNYNMDQPGFSYQILPELFKYVRPVMLREGHGDRKAATGYLKELISNTDYKRYAVQAGEFMKLYPGNEFSQSDVITAFEQFEPWCICKNILHTEYDSSGDFLLDRNEDAESSYDKLQKLVGLKEVKKQIDDVITNNLVEKARRQTRGNDYRTACMHMVFRGNPGTAKTTVAKLFAGIAKEKGILKSGAFVERGGMDLCGMFCADLIRDAFLAAKGGVLFIDEAYALKGDTATTVLIQEMENRRDDVIVIFAGYSDRMDRFMEQNEGFKSRLPYTIDFPDYSEDELTDICKLMLEERGFTATGEALDAARYIFTKARYNENFGNGRYVRNLIENSIKNQSVRLYSEHKDVDKIRKKDLFILEKEDISALEDRPETEERPAGRAMQELDEMVGLAAVKDVIHKALASFKMNKLCSDRGISKGRASCHMVFTGNPGTAKTTVARLFAEILKDEHVLPAGTFTEVGRADLVGKFVGETAQIVKHKFKEAQGGVLFIDEAYSLCDHEKNSFGDEAINTIVQEMENHREDVIVIFAGYPGPMKDFLERNPGMASRIAFHISFDDYSVDELCDITRLMVSKKKFRITDEAVEKLRWNYAVVSGEKGYGNGRYVRKMLEEAEMNMALRLEELDVSEITDELLTTIEAGDIPTAEPKKKTGVIRIGYAG